ncbi:MAG: hypothetical protein RRC34_02510 [Lentisphaeria bacterium]|nr:hypothetical protein [Lentisphaeria bacterium]
MNEKTTPGNQLKVSKTAVKQRLAAVDERKRIQQARRRRIEQAFLLLLGVFIVVIFIGIKQRSPWYVNHVEPVVQNIMTATRSGNAERTMDRASLPTYTDASESGWLEDMMDAPVSDTPPPVDSGVAPPPVPNDDPVPGSDQPVAASVVDTRTRPRPADLDFHSLKSQVRRHVFSQPASLRALEAERVTYVASARSHLILLMRFIPYETDAGGLLLKNGRTGPGAVVGANERGFLFVSHRTEKRAVIPWDTVSLEQYVAFFQYYIAKRLDLDGIPSWNVFMKAGTLAPVQGRRDAAGECLLAGLLCDWYGKPEFGEKFLRLAVQYDPRSPARKFLDP